MDHPTTPPARAGRLKLLGVVALFAAPLLLAIVLHATDWRPGQTRNAGRLLEPPVALEGLAPTAPDGTTLDWEFAERSWSLLVLAPGTCEAECRALYEGLHAVWQTQGRKADRVRLLWSGGLPADAPPLPELVPVGDAAALRARLAPALGAGDGPRVVFIDYRGFAALVHGPGIDLTGLRRDLSRLLR